MSAIVWIASSCVMILAVLTVRAIFGRKLRPGLRCALWALVLARLLIPGSLWTLPVSVESAASETALARDLAALEGVEDLTRSPDGRVTGTPRITAPAGNNAPARPSQDGGTPAVTVAENVTEREYTRLERTLALRRTARTLWAAGSIAVLVVFAVTNTGLYLKLRRRRERLDAEAPVRVYKVNGLESSCYFLGSVYVSSETAEDGLKLRHVLAHELSHRRHGDGLWAILRCAALTVHWFDPLVWVAASASRRDSELFADAGALKALGDGEREAYGETLISLSARSPRAVPPLSAATTMSGGKKALRARVELIARRPRTTLAVLLAVALIAVIAVGCAFAGSSQSGKTEGNTPEETGDSAVTPDAPDAPDTPDVPDAPDAPDSPADPDHYYYTGDGWTMEVPNALDGEPFKITVTTGDGGNYWYSLSTGDGSSLTVYRDGYSTAKERYDFMTQDGASGDEQSLAVSYTGEDGSAREERYVDCPDGGHWEITIASPGHMDELRRMAASFRATPGTEPLIESDVALRGLFAAAELENMTITLVENGVAMPTVSAAGSPRGAEYLEILRALRWADDLDAYDGEEPDWCAVLETPDFRIAFNDVGWAGVTAAGGAFQAWIVDYENLSHETGAFGWDLLAGWYNEAAAAESLTGDPIGDAELEVWRDSLAAEYETCDGETGELTVSPVNGFFLSDWSDPTQLDLGQFIAYFPISTEIGAGFDSAERAAVHAAYHEKYGEEYKDFPIHAIRVSDVDAVLTVYAGITTDDLKTDWQNVPNAIYLSEYDSLYTFTSDYGPGEFIPISGSRDGDTLTLISRDHVLTVRDSGGSWQLLSHTPLPGA